MNPSNEPEVIQEVKIEEIKPRPSHNQLHDALLGIQDLLERSQIEFVLLGDTAKAINDDELPEFHMDKIHLGITLPHFHLSGASIFYSLLKQEHYDYREVGNKILIDYKGVPVQIDVIQGHYPYFIYPSTKFYTITEFRLPNPMAEYLRNQDYVE